MYDIIRYIIKNNKLDREIAKLYTELIEELNGDSISQDFDKKMEKIHRMQFKAINVAIIITNCLSQDDRTLHKKRIQLFLFNTLIVILSTIIGFKSMGIYKALSFLLGALVATGNIIGNKALDSVIYNKEDSIQTLYDSVMARNEYLSEIRDKYAEFASKKVDKIIKEKNIDIINDKNAATKVMAELKTYHVGAFQEISFFDANEEYHETDKKNDIYLFASNEREETYQTEPTTIEEENKPKVKKRIRRDGDK